MNRRIVEIDSLVWVAPCRENVTWVGQKCCKMHAIRWCTVNRAAKRMESNGFYYNFFVMYTLQ